MSERKSFTIEHGIHSATGSHKRPPIRTGIASGSYALGRIDVAAERAGCAMMIDSHLRVLALLNIGPRDDIEHSERVDAICDALQAGAIYATHDGEVVDGIFFAPDCYKAAIGTLPTASA